MLLIFFLSLLFLSGISTIVFFILLVLKKKRAVLGLSISGGVLLISFVVSGIIGFVAFLNWANSIEEYPGEYYEEDSVYDVEDYEDEYNEEVDEETENVSDKEDTPAENVLASTLKLEKDDEIVAGHYKVGTDIPAGEYIIFSDSFGTVQVTKDNTDDQDGIIYSNVLSENSHHYFSAKKGQYVRLTESSMYPEKTVPPLKPEDGIYKEGMYKIGRDIPAGEYKVYYDKETENGIGSGSVEVLKDTNKTTSENLVDFEVIENTAYIEAKDGHYLNLREAYIDINE